MKTFTVRNILFITLLSGCGHFVEVPLRGLYWDGEGQYQTYRDFNEGGRLFYDGSNWYTVNKNAYAKLISPDPELIPVGSPAARHRIFLDFAEFFLERGEDGVYRAFMDQENAITEVPFPSFQGEIAAHNGGRTLIGLKNSIELWRWDYEGIGWYLWQELRSPADFWMLAGGRVLALSGRLAEVFPLGDGPLKAGVMPGNGPVILTQDGENLLYWDGGFSLFDLETFESRPFSDKEP